MNYFIKTLFVVFAVILIGIINCADINRISQIEQKDGTYILSGNQWIENAKFVSSKIKTEHPNPFAFSSERAFDDALSEFIEQVPRMDDQKALVKLLSLVSMLHDGHTALRGGFEFLSGKYPIEFFSFSDGIYVIAASSEHQNLIGAKLISINKTFAEEVFTKISKMTPHDNEYTILQRTPAFLSIPEALYGVGVVQSLKSSKFEFKFPDGNDRTIVLQPVSFDTPIYWEKNTTDKELPLYRQNRNENYWSSYSSKDSILYVNFNRVRNGENQTIEEFVAKQKQAIVGSPPKCIILDIRNNGGGNGYLNNPIIDWASNSSIAMNDSFYVIIGRGTFSAAQKLASALEKNTNVIFAGEPSGSRPNHFGDSNSFSLPHGDLTLSISSIFWEDAGAGDSRTFHRPDINISLSSADYFGFRDPVLEELKFRCNL